MKLCDVKRGSMVKVLGNIAIPPAAPEIKVGEVIKFLHIDGMYGNCIDSGGLPCYLVAWADVEVVNCHVPKSG